MTYPRSFGKKVAEWAPGMMTSGENSTGWRATTGRIPQKGRGSWRGAQDGVHQGGFSRERSFGVSLDVTFTFLFPGQEVKSQVMDSVDSKGSLTVKLPKEKTLDVGITFSRSPEQGIELSKTWILQKFLDSLKNK